MMNIQTTIPCPGCQSLVRATGSSQEGLFFFCPNYDCDYLNLTTNDDMVECLNAKIREELYFELDFVKAQEEQDRENQLKNEAEQNKLAISDKSLDFSPFDYGIAKMPPLAGYHMPPSLYASGKNDRLTDWSFGGMIFKTITRKG